MTQRLHVQMYTCSLSLSHVICWRTCAIHVHYCDGRSCGFLSCSSLRRFSASSSRAAQSRHVRHALPRGVQLVRDGTHLHRRLCWRRELGRRLLPWRLWYDGSYRCLSPAWLHFSEFLFQRVRARDNYFSPALTVKPGSQYDARASVASRASGWRWNRLDFYSSVACNLTGEKRTFFRDAHDARDARGASVILWTSLYSTCTCIYKLIIIFTACIPCSLHKYYRNERQFTTTFCNLLYKSDDVS